MLPLIPKKTRSLFHHQLRNSLVALLVAVVAIGYTVYSISEEALIESAQNSLGYQAKFRKERILNLFREQKQWMEEVARDPGLTGFATGFAKIYTLLGEDSSSYQIQQNRFRREYRTLLNSLGVDDLFLLTPAGELFFSLRPMESEIGVNLGAKGFYGETLFSELIGVVNTTRQMAISRFGSVEQVEESTVLMGIPLFSPVDPRQMVAVLVRPFSLGRLRNLLESYSGLGESGEVMVAQWRGHTPSDGVNFINHFRNFEESTPDEECIILRENQPERFPIRHALSGSRGEGWMIDYSCRQIYGVWNWLPELEWGIVIQQDRSEILRPVQRLRQDVLWTALLIFLFLFWMVHRQAHFLVRPIEQLTYKSEIGEIDGCELGEIREVNLLTTRLQEMVAILWQHQNRLEEKVAQRTEELAQQNREIELILNSMQEGLLVIDTTGKVVRANRCLLDLLGCTEEELQELGGALFRLTPYGHLFAEEGLVDQIEGEQIMAAERLLLDHHGNQIPAHISGALLRNREHQITGVVLVVHDLRERIATERQRVQQESELAYQEGLAEMSVNVLHNIGNAIAGVHGRIDMIDQASDNIERIGEQLQHATTLTDLPQLHAGLTRLSQLLKQQLEEYLRNSSRAIATGVRHIIEIITIQQEMSRGGGMVSTRFSLHDTLEKVTTMHSGSNEKYHIELELSLDPAVEMVSLPRNQFVQMVDNLLKNARESIIEQCGTIESCQGKIALTVEALPGERFRLSVEDNGGGIDPAMQQQIFQRGITSKREGTGVGLHSVSTFVGSIQGTVAVESAGRGEGATLRVELPQRVSAPSSPQEDE